MPKARDTEYRDRTATAERTEYRDRTAVAERTEYQDRTATAEKAEFTDEKTEHRAQSATCRAWMSTCWTTSCGTC